MGHPTVAKVPPVVSEEDPSRKRKVDEVVVPADGAKKAKGDDVVMISDDTAVAPTKPTMEAAVPTKEGDPLPGVAETASFGAGASIAMFPRFMARSATASGTSPSSRAPGVADAEVERVVGTRRLSSRTWMRYNFTACLAQPSRYVQSPRIRPVCCSGLILVVSCFYFSRPVPECALAEFQRVGT